MESQAVNVLRDYHQQKLPSNILKNEKKISFGSQKFSFDEPTPFAGMNLISLYLYSKHRNNKKKLFSEFSALSLPVHQPGGNLAKQVNEFLNSNSSNSNTSYEATTTVVSSPNKKSKQKQHVSNTNHHFSFDDEPKSVDPSLAAFDIRSSGGKINTAQNNYSYSFNDSSAETRSYAPLVSTQTSYSYSFTESSDPRSYAPPAESSNSYSYSYAPPNSEDLFSSSSRNYSLPTAPATSSSNPFGIPASDHLTPNEREGWEAHKRDNREERRQEYRRDDRERDRRPPRTERNRDRDQRRRSRSRSREREATPSIPPSMPAARPVTSGHSMLRTDIKSSLVVTPPKEFWGPIVTIKKNHMNPRIKRPPYPHITLLAPFLNFSLLPEARAVLKEKLSTIQPFKVELNNFQIFYNKTSFTLYLNPTVTPAGSLERLYKACLEVYPQCTKGPFEAHIGVGYFNSRRDAEMHLQKYQYNWKPFSFTVQEIYMMGRVSETDPFEVRQAVPLGGLDPVPLIKPVPF